MKRFPITGKGVFKDRTEGVVYAVLDNKQVISIDKNDYDFLAILSWHTATKDERLAFLKKVKLDQLDSDLLLETFEYTQLSDYIRIMLKEYQKEKLNLA